MRALSHIIILTIASWLHINWLLIESLYRISGSRKILFCVKKMFGKEFVIKGLVDAMEKAEVAIIILPCISSTLPATTQLMINGNTINTSNWSSDTQRNNSKWEKPAMSKKALKSDRYTKLYYPISPKMIWVTRWSEMRLRKA